jgi:DivIVA domain-containing protein
MSDESFHLTPLDIRRYDFGAKSFRGYDEKKVEDFRNQVAEELERLTRLNQELDSKARGFHEQLRAFRDRDKALNEALVSAQQLRSEIREQAEREAQLILREARAEGERQLDSIRNESRQLQADLVGRRKAHRAECPRLHPRRRRPATMPTGTAART